MGSTFLTKSAFKIGRSCPTKLYYYRSGYPSTLAENTYLQFLAEGGHIIGKMAQLLFPEGIMISGAAGIDAAVEETERLLQMENVVLFEAALRAGNKLVLVDILRKTGKYVELIEVKSKSFDSDLDEEHSDRGKRSFFINRRGEVNSSWREYLEDICYQEYVAELCHPELEFIPYLMVPDKSKSTSIEGLSSMFSVVENKREGSTRKELRVEFSGDPARIIEDNFLRKINVEQELSKIRAEVEEAASILDESLVPLRKISPEIGTKCRNCEYRIKDSHKSGFLECWGEFGKTEPHIFDLYFGTAIEKGELFTSLINTGKTSLFDVPEASLTGIRGARQAVQISNTKNGTEWISKDLEKTMKGVRYPLHFVDFETSRVAVPYHAGMRPYEQVAFQWSCHTVDGPGATPTHSEWINTAELFPNFEFARSLRKQIGTVGTMLTWSHHEATTLKDIGDQMEKYGEDDGELKEWIRTTTEKESDRILDLNDVTLRHYFHPAMKGKTSLKAVLPAIWNSNKSLHELPWLCKYARYDDNSVPIDPYKVLSSIEIANEAEVVQEGTGAMTAYQDMMYGKVRDDPETKESWRKLLLQYCELDTLAMLVVWVHWDKLTEQNHL